MKIQISFCTLKKSDLYLKKIQISFVKKIKFAFNENTDQFYVLKKSNLKKSDQFCVLKKQKKKNL